MKIGYSWACFRNIGMTYLGTSESALCSEITLIFCREEYISVFSLSNWGLFYVQTDIVKPNGFTRTMTKYWCDVHIYGIFCNVNCTKKNLNNLAVFPWCPLTHSGRLSWFFRILTRLSISCLILCFDMVRPLPAWQLCGKVLESARRMQQGQLTSDVPPIAVAGPWVLELRTGHGVPTEVERRGQLPSVLFRQRCRWETWWPILALAMHLSGFTSMYIALGHFFWSRSLSRICPYDKADLAKLPTSGQFARCEAPTFAQQQCCLPKVRKAWKPFHSHC